MDLVITISMVEGKESAQVCVRRISHMRWGISVVNHNLVCISAQTSSWERLEFSYIDWDRLELVAAFEAAMSTSLGPGWREAAKGCQGWV